ncbi:MAG: NlpC/P60 family protein [Bacteroidetes bacterium]|nr:MAG: NlpC/P60 family protein [Bacteroidota bacterium]
MKYLLSLLFVFTLWSWNSRVQALGDTTSTSYTMSKQDSLVTFAMKFIGIDYCRGGKSKSCFDCSGFVYTMFAKFGIDLPRTSASQATVGKAVKDRKDIRRGDIIYFKGRNRKSKKVGHVGIVVQNDGYSIMFIHASTNHGIRLEELETSAYYKARFMGARRLIP